MKKRITTLFTLLILICTHAQGQEWQTNAAVTDLIDNGMLAGVASVHTSGDRIIISGLRPDFTGTDTYYSDDDGATWTVSTSDNAVGSYAVFANGSGNTIYSFGIDIFGGLYMRTSTDRGASWTTQNPANTDFPPIFLPVHMVYTGNALLVTGAGGNAPILKSTDGGVNWDNFVTFSGVDEAKDLADIKVMGDYFYLASNEGGLYRSQSTANGWDLIRAFDRNADEFLYDILVDETTGRIYITTINGLEYSDDDGATWTLISADMLGVGSGTPDGLLFLETDLVLQMANGADSRMLLLQGLASSSVINDGLENFSSETRFLSMQSTSSSIFGIRIGDTASLWQIGTGMQTSATDEQGVPESFQLEQNYPNPFNPTTNIPFTMSTPGQARVQVYNVLGQSVATLLEAHLPAGSYTLRFDASSLPAGSYLYMIEVEGVVSSRMMTLLK